MAGRTRTTKTLAQRIDRNYFKRLFPIPRWRRALSLIFTVAGLLWLAWYAAAGNPELNTSGPIRSAHAVFGRNCVACHATKTAFGAKVTDQACQTCHDAPIHQAQQTFTPACETCHVEHNGQRSLSRTSTESCIQCHSDLKTKSGTLKVAANIKDFQEGHPEFALLKTPHKDPGAIKFNHQVHLKKELKGPKGANLQLQCADCHRSTGVAQAMPYGAPDPELSPTLIEAGASPHVPARAYMRPVNYMEHCSACHPLQFDIRIPDVAPHKKPEIVREFAMRKFSDYIALHRAEIWLPVIDPRIPARPIPPLPRNSSEWVSRRMDDAELLLWGKTCKECHNLSFQQPSKVPEVAKAAITTRWMKNGRFDHAAHRLVTCESCHVNAKTSKDTADILIPGIESCRECHRPNQENAAEARCFECHDYHDWTKEKPVNGQSTIHQLVSRSSVIATPAIHR